MMNVALIGSSASPYDTVVVSPKDRGFEYVDICDAP